MRVLIVHNRYQSSQPSGENRVVDEDLEALREANIEVDCYIRDSDEIAAFGIRDRVILPIRPTYSPQDSRVFASRMRSFRPDVVHLHNVYPLISPHVIPVAKRGGAVVVQTVHNYRHTCASGVRFRDGQVCDDCVNRRFGLPAIHHSCYRGSRGASAAMSVSLAVHRRNWRLVDRFLAVGPDVVSNLESIGVPRSRIEIRPNRGPKNRQPRPLGRDVVYVGRLTAEKGIANLLEAWSAVGHRTGRRLAVAGGGPLSELVASAAATDPSIIFLGLIEPDAVEALLESAALVVVPSIWPEPDPLVAVAALELGRPLLATQLGALGHYLDDDSGWLVGPTVDELAHGLEEACADQSQLDRRGTGAVEVAKRRAAMQRPLVDIYHELLEAAGNKPLGEDGRRG
jgi:glycosyltransferase involved in cell wall biosynthesis